MTTSYNGWAASTNPANIGIVPFTVNGVAFPGGVKGGDVATVFTFLAERFDASVERLVKGWCWGYSYRQNRNAANLSCHASGTAVDFNAPNHPNGKRGTFNAEQVRVIRSLLALCEGVVRWGGDFAGTPDEMHFEIVGTLADVTCLAREIRYMEGLTGMDFTQDEKNEVLNAVRAINRSTIVKQRASTVPGSTYVGYLDDYVLNTNADVYALRQEVASLRKALGK